MGRVRAYIGLGRQRRRRRRDARGRASMRWRRCPAPRLVAVSRLYATEPVGVVDQPEFRNAAVAIDVPAGPDPATGAVGAARRPQGHRARIRPPGARALGPARGRPRHAAVRRRQRIEVERPAEAGATTRRRPASRSSSRIGWPGNRLFVLAPARGPRARPRAARLGRDGRAAARRRRERRGSRTPSGRSRRGTATAGARAAGLSLLARRRPPPPRAAPVRTVPSTTFDATYAAGRPAWR